MNWEKLTSGSNKSSKYLIFFADAGSMAAVDAFEQMWDIVLSDVLPLNADIDWDYIRVEIWADSGRVIVYPASTQSKLRKDKAACQVFFPKLLEENDRLDIEILGPELTEKVPSKEIQEAFGQAVTELRMNFVRAAQTSARSRLIGESNLKINFYSSDDDEPLHVVTIC